MTRTILRVLPCLFLLAAAVPSAQAQARPDRGSDRTAHVTLGQSAVPLYGPWKFTIGDSPIDPKTGQPLWAEPDFDDSKWETVDLTPKNGAGDPISGQSGYVPGWTWLQQEIVLGMGGVRHGEARPRNAGKRIPHERRTRSAAHSRAARTPAWWIRRPAPHGIGHRRQCAGCACLRRTRRFLRDTTASQPSRPFAFWAAKERHAWKA